VRIPNTDPHTHRRTRRWALAPRAASGSARGSAPSAGGTKVIARSASADTADDPAGGGVPPVGVSFAPCIVEEPFAGGAFSDTRFPNLFSDP
jgi:hypothetical protein